ncbi:MAG TPA: TolC family protein [Gammaproteobacteria bacterium]|nr:TolC family protein [Gammaproteobacteria bacterium]
MSHAHIFRFLPLVAAVALLAPVPRVCAQADALTLDEALRLAAERSRQLDAEGAAASAARDLAIAARQPPDLELTTGVTNLPVDGPDAFSLTRDFMTMRSIGLSRELTRSDKRDARAERFQREAEAADAAGALTLTELQRGAALAWLERHYLERAHSVLLEQREQAALQIAAADVAFRSGLGAQADAFAARIAAGKIDDRLAESQRDVELAVTALARWIGDDATRPLASPPPMNAVSVHGGNLEEALARHPEIALMSKQEEVALADVAIARTDQRSDWTVGVMYSRRGPGFSNMMSFNFSKPLQLYERKREDRELAAKLALADRARAQREEATREHAAETASLLAAWNANRARLERYSTTLIPLASERTDAVTAVYRGNNGTLTAVLDARVAEIDMRLEQLMLEMETASLWAELTYLIPGGTQHE